MQINPAEISELIKSKIQNLPAAAEKRSEGSVISVTDGICRVHGLADVMQGEMLEFPNNTFGLALNLERDSVGAVILGDYQHIKEGDTVKCTSRILEVPVGPELLGRVVNSLGTPIDGKGDVSLDISTSGATVSQFKKALGGSASLMLRDGAINGINLAAAIRNAKAKLGQAQGAPQQGTGSAQDKTDFTELSGSFKIANGVAHNDDLSAKTPLLRLGGNGDINIGTDSLDYTVKATIVPTLEGQGGPELQELKGLTIPVKLTGPFNAVAWRIDFGAMVGDVAKAKVQEKKAAIEAEVKGKLEDRLKGLLGR